MRPRTGFLGTGWIGRHRMEALIAAGAVDPIAFVEPDEEAARATQAAAPGAQRVRDLEALLDAGLDGLVIATPSAMHAEQAIAALDQGIAVFCQKPLARGAAETRTVVEAARRADRLLAVDFSYRFTRAVEAIAPIVRSGELGRMFGAELVFHNAYGPDKAWFRDRALSGGGCVIDLGIHLVDLLLWMFDFPEVQTVDSRLFASGERLPSSPDVVEDYAMATLELDGGVFARMDCSWNHHAGRDAEIRLAVFGTEGSVAVENIGGSFYDFAAYRRAGTHTRTLVEPPDDWGGRAVIDWAHRLAAGNRFDERCHETIAVADTLDRIYRGS
jgi:predicted dehydrogenase